MKLGTQKLGVPLPSDFTALTSAALGEPVGSVWTAARRAINSPTVVASMKMERGTGPSAASSRAWISTMAMESMPIVAKLASSMRSDASSINSISRIERTVSAIAFRLAVAGAALSSTGAATCVAGCRAACLKTET